MLGAGGLPIPHLCSPLNISVGFAPPITNPLPLPILGYPEPPKSICLSSDGEKPRGWEHSPHPLPQLESSIWAFSAIPAF